MQWRRIASDLINLVSTSEINATGFFVLRELTATPQLDRVEVPQPEHVRLTAHAGIAQLVAHLQRPRERDVQVAAAPVAPRARG